MRGALRPQMAMKGRSGFAGFNGSNGSMIRGRLGALGTPDPTGQPQAGILTSTMSGSWGVASMKPGACCYDPDRPWYLPSWIETDAELSCLKITGNCSAGSITPPVPPTSACAGTIGVDANGNKTCTQVASVNDTGNTQGQLATSGEDFEAQWQAYIDQAVASATGQTYNQNDLLLAAVIFGSVFFLLR